MDRMVSEQSQIGNKVDKAPQRNSQPKGKTIRKVVEPLKGTSSRGSLKSTQSITQNKPSSSKPNGQPTNCQPKKSNHSRGKSNNSSKGSCFSVANSLLWLFKLNFILSLEFHTIKKFKNYSSLLTIF